MTKRAIAGGSAVEVDSAAEEAVARGSRVAEAWRIAVAHMQLGEIPMEKLDMSDPLPADAGPAPRQRPKGDTDHDELGPDRPVAPRRGAEPSEGEIDESVDESFPASDPPSWTKSHA